MCDFTNLYSEENGFVLRCKHCESYQIGYGGLMLSLNSIDYMRFCELLQYLSGKELPFEAMQSRNIVIPTPYAGVNFLLCQQEIRTLHQILAAAENEKLAQSMLALFRCSG
ncbi:MAG TPA: DUF6686 family protein [Arachidicoccus sp.]|nr:DUF6686 family protein [Arachidicoccus sp.]